MNLNDIIRTRHTSKAYDNSRKLTTEQQQQLLDLLRFSPSSVNSQPWHFFAVTSDEGKARILPALMDANQVKASNAAMTVVFTIKEELNEAHLLQLLEKEQQDGRYPNEEARAGNDKGRRYFVGLNSETPEQQREWMTRQAYLASASCCWARPRWALMQPLSKVSTRRKWTRCWGLKKKACAAWSWRRLVIAAMPISMPPCRNPAWIRMWLSRSFKVRDA